MSRLPETISLDLTGDEVSVIVRALAERSGLASESDREHTIWALTKILMRICELTGDDPWGGP